jgi:hypothetical protein
MCLHAYLVPETTTPTPLKHFFHSPLETEGTDMLACFLADYANNQTRHPKASAIWLANFFGTAQPGDPALQALAEAPGVPALAPSLGAPALAPSPAGPAPVGAPEGLALAGPPAEVLRVQADPAGTSGSDVEPGLQALRDLEKMPLPGDATSASSLALGESPSFMSDPTV